MASLSTRQNILRPTSNRAAVAHLGRAQQPLPQPMSNRALVGRLGVGPPPTMRVDSLLRPQPVAPLTPRPVFARLVSEAERLRQELARHDRQAAAQAAAAEAAARPTPTITPQQAGYPVPFLSPAEQARRHPDLARARQQLKERLLVQFNSFTQASYLPAFLRQVPRPAPTPATAKLTAGGRDCFMSKSFWHTQYQETPKGWQSSFVKGKHGKPGHWSTFDHWRDCCNTCKRMIKEKSTSTPDNIVQILLEQNGKLVNQPGAAGGFALLDKYMTLHKPVMIGVDFAMGETYNNDKTTEHFVVLVGVGKEKGVKYYRFFDVGTQNQDKGTNPNFKLYYNPGTGSYRGKGLLGTYTITQIRFQAL